jgi:hypothetical protein
MNKYVGWFIHKTEDHVWAMLRQKYKIIHNETDSTGPQSIVQELPTKIKDSKAEDTRWGRSTPPIGRPTS